MKTICCRRRAMGRICAALRGVAGDTFDAWRLVAKGRWAAFAHPPLIRQEVTSPRGFVSDGWCGSYHAATFTPFAVATGRTPGRARKALRRLLAAPAVDPCVVRFERRSLVRDGD